MKQFVVVGVSHKTAPVEVRERFSVSVSELPKWFQSLNQATGIGSGVYLSTCNRAELYTFLPSLDGNLTQLRGFFGRAQENFYVHVGERAVEHLFSVASGLDSLVLGESEILGQVKQAYQASRENGWADKEIHHLFQRSFYVAKRIRTVTGIARGLFSVGSAAVLLAEKIFGTLDRRRILMIGAGKMGEKTMRHLKAAGASSILVSNRSFDHATELARRLGAEPIPFEHFLDQLQEVDIVISSTSASGYVVYQKEIASLMPRRHHRPLFMIDIAVPRDIEPSVHQLEGVYLYNIDDLEQVVAESRKGREGELEKGLRLAREEAVRTLHLLEQNAG